MSSNNAHKVSPSHITFKNLDKDEEYSIDSISPLYIDNDDVVYVTVSTNRPSVQDWIGAYSPADVDIRTTTPVKFGFCSADSNSLSTSPYLTTGRTTLQFNLTNLRADVGFVYFSNGVSHPFVVASSSHVVQFNNVNEPLRNRIVPTGDALVYTVLWTSATSQSPILRWFTQSAAHHKQRHVHRVPAVTRRIEKSSLCGGVATTVGWRDLGLLHEANISLTDLPLDTLAVLINQRTIFYAFGDEETQSFSGEKVFFLPPGLPLLQSTESKEIEDVSSTHSDTSLGHETNEAFATTTTTTSSSTSATTNTDTSVVAASSSSSFSDLLTRVVLLADLGVGTADSTKDSEVFSEACAPAYNTTNSIYGNWVQTGLVDAVFHSGDISYANGYLANWDFFLDMISPIAGSVMYLTTVGNHESDWLGSPSSYQGFDSGGECGLSVELLPMPGIQATRDTPWWSYDVGLIHFVGISTEHDYTAGSAQYAWLLQDLASVNRNAPADDSGICDATRTHSNDSTSSSTTTKRPYTPWIVFSGHRPAYVDSSFCCGWGVSEDECGGICKPYTDTAAMRALQRELDPLLLKYKVNLAFSGHFHNYQRQAAAHLGLPVQYSQLRYDDSTGRKIHWHENPQATVRMVIGSAGNGPSYSNKRFSWSEGSWDELYGYAVLTAVNATYLHWQFIDSATDAVVDEMVITQPEYKECGPGPGQQQQGGGETGPTFEESAPWTGKGIDHNNTNNNSSSHSSLDNSNTDAYSSYSQSIVLIIGVLVLLLTFIGAYFHRKHTRKALAESGGERRSLLRNGQSYMGIPNGNGSNGASSTNPLHDGRNSHYAGNTTSISAETRADSAGTSASAGTSTSHGRGRNSHPSEARTTLVSAETAMV